MSFHKKTIRDMDLHEKRVLVRVDYNVPMKNGKIIDDYRIRKSLDTINYLLDKKCKIILCSHLGRPEGRPHSEMSLKPVADRLSSHLNRKVEFVSDCVGEEVTNRVVRLNPGQILMLENVRFHPEEESKDADKVKVFAKQMAALADVFVQDAFGVVHHGAVSVSEIPKYIPGVAGLLLEKEVVTINQAMENPKRPLMAIIGGAKISDKIDILERFVDIADILVIGGGMANTFLLAQGISVGKSLAEKKEIPDAKVIIEKARRRQKEGKFILYIPQDGIVASRADKLAKTRIVDWDAHVIAETENYPKSPPRNTMHVGADEMILDIGPFSGAFIAGSMQMVGTVVWNGAMGVTEVPSINGPVGPFAWGTEMIVDAMLGQYGRKPYSVLGGGDTVGFVESRGLVEKFNHVSTGGGASMELMSGRKLPGVEALQNT
ncbi:MAG: phosphoglycerate kinase [Candidatus Saccharimonadales bacterium]